MNIIPLNPTPNQSLSIILDNDFYDITIKECRGIMACDIIRNNEILQTGIRIVSGYPLLPYLYQVKGNFFVLTNNGDYPYYLEFGSTQFLIYVNIEEVENFIAGT